jgi:mono/diheme cytochrome c family protein
MKKLSSIIFSVAILASACMVRRSEPVKGRNFTPENADIKHGEQVFMSYCHKCHPAGESGLGPAINSNPAPSFLKKFQVRHGLGVMPAFKADALSKKDLQDVAKYLKAWKRY